MPIKIYICTIFHKNKITLIISNIILCTTRKEIHCQLNYDILLIVRHRNFRSDEMSNSVHLRIDET